MIIVVGLGNPGAKYANNRHNIGCMVVNQYAANVSILFEEKKIFHAHVAITNELLLAKPDTFMNDSGLSAKALTKQYGEKLVVIYDDIDVTIGTVKCSFDRGAGGHNGVQSIIDHLGHKNFFRIRVGVRPVHEELLPRIAPPDGFEKFLLSDFTPMEDELVEEGIRIATKILYDIPSMTFEEIMNKWN